MKLNFELLTRSFNFYFSTFELLTRSWKIKNSTLSYYLEMEKYKISLQVTNSMVRLLFFRFWVTNLKLKNKKFHF